MFSNAAGETRDAMRKNGDDDDDAYATLNREIMRV